MKHWPLIPYILIGLAAIFTAACSEIDDNANKVEADNHGVPGSFYEVEVKGMPCVVWIHQMGAGNTADSFSGLSCDWRSR